MAPTLASTTAGGEDIKIPGDLRFTISNPPNPQAYAITSQTFVVMYQDPCKAGASSQVAKGLKAFITYALGDGQNALAQLQYAKLPSAIESQAKAQISKLQCNGKAVS